MRILLVALVLLTASRPVPAPAGKRFSCGFAAVYVERR